jgi:TonB-dependent SusC/RagA subfamily outer membrane receptor
MPKLPSRPSPRIEASRVSQSQRPPRRRAARRAAPPAAQFVAALALAALPGALLVAAAPAALGAQPAARGTARVQGVVTSNNAPVGNAQVSLVGTRYGALSDNDGRYSINGVPAGSYTMRVQRIGFAPLTRPVTVADGQTVEANLAITAQAAQLSEVAVVGYTTEQRRDISGAVATVRGDELRDQVVATVEEALRGRAPGVQIAATGQPGRPAQIIIRGQNGFNAPNPLYVVDGMYVGQQNPNINPDDIASVEVLKDASAAAQYGAQASNGVVVITTRRGQAGQNQFSLSTFAGVQQVPKRIPLAGAAEFQRVFLQAYANANAQRRANEQLTVPAGLQTLSGPSTDWQDAVFRTGAIQNYNLTASGGTSTANYLLSGSVLDQKGTLINTGFRRYNLRVNSQATRGRFTVGEALALSQGNQTDFPNGIFGGTAAPLIDVVQLLPLIPVRDTANPGGYGYGSDALPNYGVNPVAVLERNYLRRRGNQVLGTAYGEVGCSATCATASTSASTTRLDQPPLDEQHAAALPDAQLNGASLTRRRPRRSSCSTRTCSTGTARSATGSTASRPWRGRRRSATSSSRSPRSARASRTSSSSSSTRARRTGSTTTASRSPSARTRCCRARRTPSATATCSPAASGATARRGSAPATAAAPLAPAPVGWVASEEGFFKAIPLIGGADFLKLRASTGVLGDQNIGDYQTVVPIAQNINYIVNGPSGGTVVSGGATQLRLANTDLRWQRNQSTDIGLDLGLLGNRLSITADYYVNVADGVLVNIPIPASLGSTRRPGVQRRQGAQRRLRARRHAPRRARRLAVQQHLHAHDHAQPRGVPRNGGQPISRGIEGVSRTRIGEPIGAFYVLRTAGIFQSQADVDAYTASVTANGQTSTVKIQPDAKPGDLRFVDVNGDGRIKRRRPHRRGEPDPDAHHGPVHGLALQAFDVGSTSAARSGNKIYNASSSTPSGVDRA